MGDRVAYINRASWDSLPSWGRLPGSSLGCPGTMWTNGDPEDPLIYCIVRDHACSTKRLHQRAKVVFTDGRERLPSGWRKAIRHYVREWPESAAPQARWAYLSEGHRAKLAIRWLQMNADGRDKLADDGRRRLAILVLGGRADG